MLWVVHTRLFIFHENFRPGKYTKSVLIFREFLLY